MGTRGAVDRAQPQAVQCTSLPGPCACPPAGCPHIDYLRLASCLLECVPHLALHPASSTAAPPADILEQNEPAWIHDINLKKLVLGDKASGWCAQWPGPGVGTNCAAASVVG